MSNLRQAAAFLAISSSLLLAQQPLGLSGKPGVRLVTALTGKAAPKWSNGYFVTIDPLPGPRPIISLLESSGEKRFDAALAMDGVVSVIPRGLAASAEGRVAVVGAATDAAGSRINFLALLHSGGAVERVVRMDKFAGVQVCFAPNGSLWVLGQAISPPSPDYDMIRVYSREGVLQRSLLPRSLFPAEGDPTVSAHLAANSQNIALYSGQLGFLTVINQAGEILSIKRVPLPADDALLTGLALSEASQVLMSCQIPDASPGARDAAAFFRSDPDWGSWRKVYERAGKDRGGYHAIFGTDGEDILVSSRLPDLHWVRLPE